MNYFSGKSQHFCQTESGRVSASVGQREALHPGHGPRPLFPQQSEAAQHPQGRSILVGPAGSQVNASHRNKVIDAEITLRKNNFMPNIH